jgi:hypothetical protein
MASPSAALTFLADLSGWLLAGGRMLQAIDLLERRQVRLQTRAERETSAAEGMRIRALWLAGVWVALAVVGGPRESVGQCGHFRHHGIVGILDGAATGFVEATC